jgi:REP element-mobilizing transposase RayT
MSKYKFTDQSEIYFISTATVYWIDVFTRSIYKDILIDSLKFCVAEKDLEIYAYCIMTNHFNAIIGTKGRKMEATLRDMKQFTAKSILKAIEENPLESRKEWLLWMFERAGKYKAGNEKYQFWQHDNHPIWLKSPEVIEQKLKYIHNNPIEAGFVNKPEDWWYSSAKNYLTNEPPLLDVILL